MVYHHPKGSPSIFDNKNGGVRTFQGCFFTSEAHMLSDVGGFIVSLVALQLSRMEATQEYTYGFKQAGYFITPNVMQVPKNVRYIAEAYKTARFFGWGGFALLNFSLNF